MDKKLIKIFVFAFTFRFFISFLALHQDVRVNMDWGVRFFEYGASGFYSPDANVWNYTWPNQPPGTIYLYAFVRKLYEYIFSIFWFINLKIALFPSRVIFFLDDKLYPVLLKLPSILADLGISWLIYRVLKDQKREKLGLIGAAVFLFNPLVWYNSALWGQTDAFVNLLGFVAFYLLWKKKLLGATTFLILSIYVKLSLLIFVPIFFILVLKQGYKFKEILLSLFVPFLMVGLITLPFSRGEPYSWLFWLYRYKVLSQQLQVITANAFNIWAAINGIEEVSHKLLLGPLSFQTWGWILFGVSLFPILLVTWKSKKSDALWWVLAMTAFSSFMFLTNMHERYLYPLFPYFTILAVKERKLMLTYAAISLINLVNLYNYWWVPRIEVFIGLLTFDEKIVPRILGLTSFLLFIKLYLDFVKRFRAT